MKTNILHYIKFPSPQTDEVFVYAIILIMVLLILCMYVQNKRSHAEGFKNEINQAIREIKGVGKRLNELPKQIGKVGKDVKGIGGEIGSSVNKVVKDTKNIGDQIEKQVQKGVQKIEDEGNKITKMIDNKFWWFIGEVERSVKDIVKNKILGFFSQLGKALEKGIVDPLDQLFAAVGTVFKLLGEILQMIIDKIVNLPDCVPYYSFSASNSVSKKFLPGWMVSIIDFWTGLGGWLLNVFKPVLVVIGIDVDGWKRDIDEKCFKFRTKSKTREMERVMKNAGKNFANNFGKMKIKIE